jgi:hypothetical protein
MKNTLPGPRGPRFHGRAPVRGSRFLGDVVRRVRADLPGPTAQDHQLLSDIARERYSTTWLARLIDLAARCPDPAVAYTLPNAIRAAIDAQRAVPATPTMELVRRETETQAAADWAVTEALVGRTATGAEVAREALEAHIHAAEDLRQLFAGMAR